MSFYNPQFKALVQLAQEANKIKDGEISNDSPLLGSLHGSHRHELETLAKKLGIDFSKTGFTYRLSGKYLNTPEIKSVDGLPVLEWGNVKEPLVRIISNPDFYVTLDKQPLPKGGSRFSVLMESKETTTDSQGDEVPVHRFEFRVAADSKTPVGKLQAAFRDLEECKEGSEKRFGSMLLQKPKPVSSLEDGEYTVIGYKSLNGGGYSVALDSGVTVYANTSLKATLEGNPEISREKPATLRIHSHGKWVRPADGQEFITCKANLSTFAQKEILANLEAFTPFVEEEEEAGVAL